MCAMSKRDDLIRHERGSVWTPFNIGMMVLGFVFFWPVGLILLFWLLNGRPVGELPGAIRDKVRGWKSGEHRGGWEGKWAAHRAGTSGNRVFDEYQQTQLDRIDEIRAEVRSRSDRFADYRADARRRQDQAEFDSFMHRGSEA